MGKKQFAAAKVAQGFLTRRQYPLQNSEQVTRGIAMGGSIFGANGRPVMSPDQEQAMAVLTLRTNLYMSLVPVVAAKRLVQGERWKGEGSDETTAEDEIANEADQITLAALRRMGIVFQATTV